MSRQLADELHQIVFESALDHIGHRVCLEKHAEGREEWVTVRCMSCDFAVAHFENKEAAKRIGVME